MMKIYYTITVFTISLKHVKLIIVIVIIIDGSEIKIEN